MDERGPNFSRLAVDGLYGQPNANGVPPWPPEPESDWNAAPYVLLRDLQMNLINNEIVRDLLPRNALVEVHAVAGGGKTAIIVDLCLHIADGREYCGRAVDMQPVVYVALEGHGGIDNRIIAAGAELGLTDVPFALVKSTDNFRDPEAVGKVAAVARELMKLYGGSCPVVVLDTYTAALGAGASDCDPEAVTAFLKAIQTHLLGLCTVIITHHFGKDSSRGGRGWSGLNAALDVELEIDREDELRTMRVTKSRDGSDSQPGFCYNFRAHELGLNNHGEPVTAVVVDHLANEDRAKPSKQLPPRARAALDRLWACIKDPGRSFPLPESHGLRCVTLTEWEKACIGADPITKANNIEDRKRVFRKMRQVLIEAGAIISDGANGERVYPKPKREEEDE